MKMEQHIAQLLYRYQCVTVPGFGAFLTEIQPAQLLESTNTFYPPKKVVSFNAHLKNNDGLLANHISQMEKIGYEVAVQNISKEVSLWKNALLNHQNVVLNSIGTLHLNISGTLTFEATTQVNFHTSSFGLNTFVSPTVKREVIEKMPEAFETEPIILVPETATSFRYSYLKYAAVFIVALTAAGSIGLKMHETQMDEEMQLVQTEVQKDVQNKIQEATFFIESPVHHVTLSVKSDKAVKMPYHIMAGVYREEKNADKTLRILTNLGYNAKRIAPNKNGFYPVLYGSYATFAEAEKAKKEINIKHNPEAWILIQSL